MDTLSRTVVTLTCTAAEWIAGGDRILAEQPNLETVVLTTLPTLHMIQAAGGMTWDGTDWPPMRFLRRRWPGVREWVF